MSHLLQTNDDLQRQMLSTKTRPPGPPPVRASHARGPSPIDLTASTSDARQGPVRPGPGLKTLMPTGSSMLSNKPKPATQAPFDNKPVRPGGGKLSTQAGLRPQAPAHHRSSTITPMRKTITPGISLTDFQRLVAAGGDGSPGGRPEDIELPDIDSK